MAKTFSVLTSRPSSFNAVLTKNDLKLRLSLQSSCARHQSFPPSPHIYIGNLPADWIEDDVLQLVLSVTGTPLRRIYLRQKYPGSSQHAFVLVSCTNDAHRCVAALDGFMIMSHRFLKVIQPCVVVLSRSVVVHRPLNIVANSLGVLLLFSQVGFAKDGGHKQHSSGSEFPSLNVANKHFGCHEPQHLPAQGLVQVPLQVPFVQAPGPCFYPHPYFQGQMIHGMPMHPFCDNGAQPWYDSDGETSSGFCSSMDSSINSITSCSTDELSALSEDDGASSNEDGATPVRRRRRQGGDDCDDNDDDDEQDGGTDDDNESAASEDDDEDIKKDAGGSVFIPNQETTLLKKLLLIA
jgi:hypothetical protein